MFDQNFCYSYCEKLVDVIQKADWAVVCDAFWISLIEKQDNGGFISDSCNFTPKAFIKQLRLFIIDLL